MNKKLLGLMFFVMVIFVVSVMAFDEPCRCTELCEGNHYCYMGNCTNDTLEALGCGEISVPDGRCPVCPICKPLPDCYDEVTHKFKYPGDVEYCKNYWEYLINDENNGYQDNNCYQTINFKTYKRVDGISSPLIDVSISLLDAVDGIDYTDVFADRYEKTNSEDYLTVPRCRGQDLTTFVASKENYDADAKDVLLENDNISEKYRNFTLPLGICHTDCTNSYGRCNPECQGFEEDPGNKCDFYVDNTYGKNVTKLCAYKLKGTEIVLEVTNNDYTIIDCCEGINGVQTIARPESNVELVKGQNLIATEKPIRFTDSDPGKILVYYWEGR